MKKVRKITAAALAALTLLCSACSEKTEYVFGYLGLTEPETQDWEGFVGDTGYEALAEGFTETKYDGLNGMIAALEAEKIDIAELPEYVAKYVSSWNEKLTYYRDSDEDSIGFFGKMMTSYQNRELCNALSEALDALDAEGTLSALNKEWFETPNKCETADTDADVLAEGAETIYTVGITGDYAPIDYMGADGKPAGYAVALLDKIKEKTGFGFRFISVDWQARTTALASGKADIILASDFSFGGAKEYEELGVAATREYFSGNYTGVILSRRKDEIEKKVTKAYKPFYGEDYYFIAD